MRLLTGALVVFMAGSLFADSNYLGVDKCAKMCHKSKAKGDQLSVWKESSHAKAFSVLATPAALETAKKVGLAGDPQKSEKCLKCHVTAFGVDASRLDSTYAKEDGVGCEACHGAGSGYAKLKIMKDKKAALAAGLIIPDEKTCVKCHNTDSPNYKKFNFVEMAKKIAHPMPKQAEAKEGETK